VVAGPPRGDVVVPTPVAKVARGRDVRAVWENERGGLTFEVGRGTERVFVKWSPAGSMIHLGREVERLAWARPFTVVPKVMDQRADDAGSWLVTEALPGESAVSDRWHADPAVLRAHPEASVELGTDTKPVVAREARGDERDRIWEDHKQQYPGFAEYEAKTDREIPVVILEVAA
jgi:deazaflavin-dependent oxidoreductase (nitroreductase family)